MNIETGTVINQYKIISAIGKGGMGEVFLAEDTKLKRQVALKILPSEFAEDKDRMSRFVREAQSASALNHPNIITIYEIGESDGTHFIATEFIDGKTLNDYKKANPLNYKSALEIAIQVASALDEAHSAGIVHRDIKPDNVMVRSNGLAKILDFGIAKVTATAASDEEAATTILAQTQAGMIIGTPNYMSPEQARGKDVDHQTDIFSFGVVFYEMLSGDSPFKGETVSDVIAAVLTKEPKRLNDIPIGLEEILNKSLEKNKKNRYQTAKDLLRDLQEAKEELSIQTRLEKTSSPNIEEPKTQILQAVTTAETDSNKSIAVLPFTNMSADEDNEYFCEGLAEELLNALSKINDLKVAARTSAFSFKGKNANVSEIGEKLGVKNVLEGSVRKSGSKLRISVQLVNASDGYQIWSERYDREMKDIFDVQDEIALAVVDALKLKLFGDEKKILVNRYTDNTEVYELYLKGRFHYHKYTVEGWLKAVEFFEQAIAIEPDYAAVYASLGLVYFWFYYFGVLPADEAIGKMRTATSQAVELDDSSSDAHLCVALMNFLIEWNFAEAEREFLRAIELDSNNPMVWHFYSFYLATMNKYDEAVHATRKALELDPLSMEFNGNGGWAYVFAERFDEALRQSEKTIQMDANFHGGYWVRGGVQEERGQLEEAIESYRKAWELSGISSMLSDVGSACGQAGRRGEALEILRQLFEMRKQQPVPAFDIARVYAALGDVENAIEWLEKAAEDPNGELIFINRPKSGHPFGKAIRRDPRFQNIIRRMGLPERKTHQTDESLEAKTVMLKSEPPEVTSGLTQSSQESNKNSTTSNDDLQPSATADGSDKSRKSKYIATSLLTLLLAVGGFFGYKYFSPTKQIESIAVLPFENKSSDADSEYLSDGLAESLIYRLSQLPNLKVSPTSSVFRYKGKETDPQVVAKELGVDSVMTGRITQRGDNLTISVNLVDTRNGKSLWGEQYERKMSELLTTQREIASEITNKLQLKLSGAGEQKLAKQYTTNNEAYQFYLKGKYHYAKRTKEDILKGIEYFEQAISLDPNFALAYVEISDSYSTMPAYPYMSPKEAFPKAKAAAQKALAIDPTLAEAHSALGFSLAVYDWNWAEAKREFEKAIELNPNLSFAHFRYGWNYLLPIGSSKEAIKELKHSLELEPMSLVANSILAIIYADDGQNEQALAQARKIYDLEPNFPTGRWAISHAFIVNGMYSEAIELNETSLQTAPTNQLFLRFAGYGYAKSNRRKEAEAIIIRFRELSKTEYVMAYRVANIYAALGEKDKAFVELEKAFGNHDWELFRLKVDPLMEPLRDDPRYKDLLKRMGLPE